ncbi:hypothetical protein GTQ34_10785 [Muricauda sp. JGD-17]|uniref:Cellobiose phosphorylase n=1 Tax=Flagellimonas ochracea TaxID=2696472 RepID=A0A964TCP4_9FLAO|nr:hypothetical protein [Allomuricauda ochracea]NAY92405.1 hypothetical protein [Allomuricauda ochracea]
MSQTDIYLASTKMNHGAKEVVGESVVFENENYYKISNYDGMRPFFMSIVSHSDHWMFISSNGGLTAGRKNPESALFPYYTDDKVTESANITGNKTIIHAQVGSKTYLWEPFSNSCAGVYTIQRNLYKSNHGNKIVFEEVNKDLGLTFRYHWNFSETYGFVKKSNLINHGDQTVKCALLDGIQNILPYGVPSSTQNDRSNLVDAYKRNQLEAEIGLGIFALSAIIVDRAEPSEALKATTVWSTGLDDVKYLVSSLQLDTFRRGNKIAQETDVKAEKGAYFIHTEVSLEPKAEKNWMIIADLNKSRADVSKISHTIKSTTNLFEKVEADIDEGSKQLLQLAAASDAIQCTSDSMRDARHFSNTLFNIMRGGIFDDGYQLEKRDFTLYIKKANKPLFQEKRVLLNGLPSHFSLEFLRKKVDDDDNPDFRRLALEYLPLKFSRRHGDPSRPWNRFSINTRADDGSKVLDYEGNWRDIFQNWEALALSYPAFLESMIYKFLNASTFDGYNPYRVTKDGFDWEVIEPDDPWSYIGYWGDHQIIYLLKLLELMESHYPNELGKSFFEKIFVYANVPYKIKSYEEILEDPKDTILFDSDLDHKINKQREKIGADAAFLTTGNASIYHVTLLEKILATVLSKMSNFIPEGGIWMNTQRPEWNDANNALVGNGVSMVTLYYLRRFLSFFQELTESMEQEEFTVSEEMATFFNAVLQALIENQGKLSGKISDADRRFIMDALGMAGSEFRNTIYAEGFKNESQRIAKKDLQQFIDVTLKYLEHSIDANQRKDKLYHAYNIMTVESDTEVSISYLSEMLEGQVAVLSSGYLNGEKSLEVLDALKSSALFREDQYSYLLYPNKALPRFCEKNSIPPKKVQQSELLQKLVKEGNTSIVEKSIDNTYHFNGSFNNADSLKEALSQLPDEEYGELARNDRKLLLNTFEEIFDHKSFTGRSGTFYGYEGLGSIYWHMVSKLLLSVQETCLSAIINGENEVVIGKLLEHFYEINEGIGVHKPPKLYGAFPTDPYSHTPAGKGAQQPGMTGQVKEDILSRFGELGVFVSEGKLFFNPCMLRKDEFLEQSSEFNYVNVDGEFKKIMLEKGSLGFTYCQVPIQYRLSKKEHVEVSFKDGSQKDLDGLDLDATHSSMLFGRIGEIEGIKVWVDEKRLK